MQDQTTDDLVYQGLDPEVILDAVETYGVRCTGAMLALNSYENRVYKLMLEEAEPLVVKFYRPGRWPDAAILEEHQFSHELADHELPVIAPLPGPDAATLQYHKGFRFAVFPCQGGRAPELQTTDDWLVMGRLLGRMHAIGGLRDFQYRPTISVKEFGTDAVSYLLEHSFIPAELIEAYYSLTEDVLPLVADHFTACKSVRIIRLHGDYHLGNVLWTEQGPHLVDLDDCRAGPAIQDLWMLLSGDRNHMQGQLMDLLDGYNEFYDFDTTEVRLIEALRTLRIIHYSAWLARRWGDPAFPRNFPWFNSVRYWEEQILSLREQFALMQESPLHVD